MSNQAVDRVTQLDIARRNLLMRKEELAHAAEVHEKAAEEERRATVQLRALLDGLRMPAEIVIQPH